MTDQLDIIRDDPARNAQAWRTAADMALVNPWFDDKTKQARYEHYIAEAQRLEALPASDQARIPHKPTISREAGQRRLDEIMGSLSVPAANREITPDHDLGGDAA